MSNTTIGGNVLTGIPALTALLGVRGGRFSVNHAEVLVEDDLEGELPQLLTTASRPLQTLIDQVALGGILDLERVALREDTLADYLEVAPLGVREVVEELGAGAPPRDLMLKGRMSPREMEMVVIDMIRRGVITEVWSRAAGRP